MRYCIYIYIYIIVKKYSYNVSYIYINIYMEVSWLIGLPPNCPVMDDHIFVLKAMVTTGDCPTLRNSIYWDSNQQDSTLFLQKSWIYHDLPISIWPCQRRTHFLGNLFEKHSELPSEDARCQDLNQTIQKMACHSIEGFLRYNMV